MSKLYGIGVGPGDPELLTLKALKTIKKCDVLICPVSKERGESIAFTVVKDFIESTKEVKFLHFPMGKKDKDEKYIYACDVIENLLLDGKDVAFLTIGDPYFYSTYINIYKYFKSKNIDICTIPGINSFSLGASIVNRPLVLGDEPIKIVPAKSINKITDEKYVVVMKVYNREREVIEFLEDKGFDYVLISRAGRAGEKVLYDREEIINSREYMSLILASKE